MDLGNILLKKLLTFFRLLGRRITPSLKLRDYVTVFSLIFLSIIIFNNAEELISLQIDRASLLWMTLAFFVSLISILVNALAWIFLLKWLGYKSKKIKLLTLFITSNLLKYLPGGIWHFIERLRVLRSEIHTGQAAASVVLEPVLMSVAALLFVPLGGWQSGLGVLCILPAILLFSKFREPLIRKLEGLKFDYLKTIKPDLFNDKNTEKSVDRKTKALWKPLLIEMLFVFLRFLGFWSSLQAFSIEQSLPINEWLAAFCFAWTLGLIVPGAPGGIGIFESSLYFRLGSSVPQAEIIAVLLCYRVFVSVADLFIASGAYLVNWILPKSKSIS